MKMKMRLSAFLAFAMLSISILSYGVNGSVFADDHNVPPLSASTDFPIYGNGDKVTISGNIKNYDSNIHSGDITLVIWTPDGKNRVSIAQISPSSDGSFQHTFTAGGSLWLSSGDYTVVFKCC